jgi:hypothetical protein
VIDSGVCRRLVELLLHASACVLIPALRTVGNIVTGNDQQTQMIINCSVAPCLLALLTHNHKKSIKKEACWTISNVTAGNKDQVRVCVRSCAEKESRSHCRRLPKLTTKQNSLSAPKRLFGSLVFLGHTIALSAVISLAGSLVRSHEIHEPRSGTPVEKKLRHVGCEDATKDVCEAYQARGEPSESKRWSLEPCLTGAGNVTDDLNEHNGWGGVALWVTLLRQSVAGGSWLY